ncbi:hypothetical protein NQ315_013711 [Exocentrus adspersus]|uniref:Uncharacterized protein n=1 Tax=Exocentrus adspersus TaxID=1586481 RepID=A0AAV8W4H4_9CUCU|nr:hypothetical protein NQ315_013711 [Exocentrus adspersus]
MSQSTPICRCRVLYLGSSVPQQTKDGLQGIQEPLQELYPDQGATGARGIDSWLSVWSNGILLENVDENHKKITRFFPIESLHYCAAVSQKINGKYMELFKSSKWRLFCDDTDSLTAHARKNKTVSRLKATSVSCHQNL